MKNGAVILAVKPGHHRQDADATISLKFHTSSHEPRSATSR